MRTSSCSSARPSDGEEAARVVDATFLPPAALGDITRAVSSRPRVIGLIDGYFEHRPAVAHKEVLFAMTSGVHVVGAASMGALRAAELSAFGMEGVGAIFDDYLSGRLTCDDEVAVAHTIDDGTYRATAEALVNVRATLRAAVDASILTDDDASALVGAARALFYRDRSWAAITHDLRRTGDDDRRGRLGAFDEWRRHGAVDLKRADALALLNRVEELAADPFRPKVVDFAFSRSGHWRDLVTLVDTASPPEESPYVGPVLDELRLDQELYRRVTDRATIRALALLLADEVGATPTQDHVQSHVDAFRVERDLGDAAQVDAWRIGNDLDDAEAKLLLVDDARQRWAEAQADGLMVQSLIDVLKRDGLYAELAGRARRKTTALAARGLSAPSPQDLDVDEAAVLAWFCAERLDGAEWTPDDVAAHLGFEDRIRLLDVLVEEYALRDERDSHV